MAKGGIGLSLVSRNPAEELLYAFMSFVVVDYQSSSTHRCVRFRGQLFFDTSFYMSSHLGVSFGSEGEL
jgi:hypothetical protein